MRATVLHALLSSAVTLAALLSAALAPISASAVSPAPAEGKRGMVVTTQRLASEVGIKILEAGGNAVDAAVAVGYALAVVDPCCGNIGGGGFMTIRLADGRAVFVNFREKAPLKASRDMYLDAKGEVVPGRSTRGYLAIGVPGTVLGLDTALKKYGTMSRDAVMAPSIFSTRRRGASPKSRTSQRSSSRAAALISPATGWCRRISPRHSSASRRTDPTPSTRDLWPTPSSRRARLMAASSRRRISLDMTSRS